MSRASALAYDNTTLQEAAARHARTSEYRLLGDAQGEVIYRSMVHAALSAEEPRRHLELLEPPPDYAVSEAPLQSRFWIMPQWSGAAGAALALLALGAVLLWLVQTRSSAVHTGLSHYASMPLGATAAQVPVINVAAGEPESAQSAQPAARSVQIAPSGYDVEGPPSISVSQIESVLQQYGSPAVGLGQSLYDLGVKYGIDPAYALAFFVHESGCGTRGVARFTRSLGNIRWVEGYDDYDGYRSYTSWQSGMEDWYKLIKSLYIGGWNLRTVDAIVPVYAPSADNNDPSAYAASVKRMVDSWRVK